jgi:cytochrome P450
MAGHETTGNTLAFTILLLAIYPAHQTAIQRDLDAQLGSRTSREWNVEHDYPALQKGHLGAVLKEVLRLYNVIQFIFRLTVEDTRMVDKEGVEHVVPKGTTCLINVAAAFQNPAVWAGKDVGEARRKELHCSQAIDFRPERWLDEDVDEDELGFWPFGYASRKCPGMPFAQVEMVAVLAAVLKEWSVELVVGEEVVVECGGDRERASERVRDDAVRRMRDDVEANINIQMLKEVPVRLVRRG